MTQIEIGSTLVYDVREPTIFLLKIAAATTEHQQTSDENLTFDPPVNVEQCQVGLEGNRLHRVVVEPCQLSIQYQATANLTPDIERARNVDESQAAQMPPEVLTYMNPSRYCESDVLARFAYEEFGQLPPGFNRVQAISDWVFEHLEYTPGSTTATSTAADVLLQRTGVCRDYAHLAISLCRGIGIPSSLCVRVRRRSTAAGLPRVHGSVLGRTVVPIRSNSTRLHTRSGSRRRGKRRC